MRSRERLAFRILFVIIVCSMTVTELLLIVQGRWREAIPLHLCSLSAIAAAMLAIQPRRALMDALWYLGMPGAALALLFPAPASSVCQMLLDASYYATHAMILVIPLCRMNLGLLPRAGKTAKMLLLLLGIGALANCANGLLGTDFLFLAAPPAGTPLETVFTWGYPLYLMTLFAMMLLCCMGMDVLAGRLQKNRQ